MEIPTDGYWHVKASVSGHTYSQEILDFDYDRLVKEIVEPYRNNQEFLVGEIRVVNRDKIESIKIIWTEHSAAHYGKQSLSSSSVIVFAPDVTVAFERGEDFTSYLLYSEEFNGPKFHPATMLNKDTPQPNVPQININQNQNNNQETNVTVTISVEQLSHIESIQDVFEDFRDAVEGEDSTLDKRLSEIQDQLDSISLNSSQEGVVAPLTKVKRLLGKASDAASKIGGVVSAVPSGIEALNGLKATYNMVGPSFGLPPLP